VFITEYYLGIRIRKYEMGGACGTYGGKNYIQGLGGEFKRNDTTGKISRVKDDNIKVDFKAIVLDILAHVRTGSYIHDTEPSNFPIP
jgi:hypothetical protein